MPAGARCRADRPASTTSPWVRVSRVPVGPRAGNRSQPLSSSPRSSTIVPGRGRLDPTGAMYRTRRVAGPWVATSRSRSSISGPSSGATGRQPSPPPRNQSGSSSRRSSDCPSIRSAARTWLPRPCQDRSVATSVERPGLAGHQREQQSGPRPPAVGPALEAVPAPEPTVGEQHHDRVRTRAEEGRDVVGLDLEPFAVGGEARRQLEVADPGAVDVRLVDPVGSGEAVHRPVAGPLEHRPEQVDRAPSRLGRRAALVRSDPARLLQRGPYGVVAHPASPPSSSMQWDRRWILC